MGLNVPKYRGKHYVEQNKRTATNVRVKVRVFNYELLIIRNMVIHLFQIFVNISLQPLYLKVI